MYFASLPLFSSLYFFQIGALIADNANFAVGLDLFSLSLLWWSALWKILFCICFKKLISVNEFEVQPNVDDDEYGAGPIGSLSSV